MKTVKITALLLAFVLLAALCGCNTGTQPTEAPSSQATDKIIITEVSSKNDRIIADMDGQYSDYIELHNPTSNRLPLKGYYLSDNEKEPKKWALPNIYIEAGEYLVIFASGKNVTSGEEYHTSFSISATEGEPISLTNSDGSYSCKVEISACSIADVSYGLVQDGDGAGSYAWFTDPTPGARNSGSHAPTVDELQFDTVGICINEFMTKNETAIADSDGDYSDFIELYNPGSSDVDLSGMFLSDDINDVTKWSFPEGSVIKAGEYLVIFASGKDKKVENEIHTDFKLSQNDNGIIMSDKRQKKIDSVQMVLIPDNVSYGLKDGVWMFVPKPTPSAENTTPAFEEI